VTCIHGDFELNAPNKFSNKQILLNNTLITKYY
jgi:hypothetical protein